MYSFPQGAHAIAILSRRCLPSPIDAVKSGAQGHASEEVLKNTEPRIDIRGSECSHLRSAAKPLALGVQRLASPQPKDTHAPNRDAG
jgi:hypothetical protein